MSQGAEDDDDDEAVMMSVSAEVVLELKLAVRSVWGPAMQAYIARQGTRGIADSQVISQVRRLFCARPLRL